MQKRTQKMHYPLPNNSKITIPFVYTLSLAEHIMGFSRLKSKERAIKIKTRRAHIMLISNPGYRDKHVSEARDASQGKYTLVDKRIKEETELKQLRNEKFRSKLHGN